MKKIIDNLVPVRIAIIGYGIVGKQVEKLIKDHYKYVIYDPNIKSTDDPNVILATKEGVNLLEMAIICVPTPMSENGSCDTSIVEEVVSWLKTPLILIKSTIEPGTTDILNIKYGFLEGETTRPSTFPSTHPEIEQYCKDNSKRTRHIVFSPEFIGESTYYNPIMTSMMEEPFMIFGGDPKDTQAMVDIFQPIKGPLCKYIQCSAIEAELSKYMENSFYATKVAFFNEFFDICEKVGVEYDRVRELFLNDPRVNRFHTSVFKNGKRGFGGKCFPKDILALVRFAEKNGYKPEIMKQVIATNDKWQKLNN